ncbi:unnamed protein product [Durusdinium trenchii]|uniref:TIR domain-containing protein n=1 Tax=Durusdinium trenchii TaxID=1381693 RepID=A0ABP0Q6N3_9DINO
MLRHKSFAHIHPPRLEKKRGSMTPPAPDPPDPPDPSTGVGGTCTAAKARGPNARLCSAPSARTQAPMKIVSDVDDTLYGSGGHFPAGCDERFPRHQVYPGVLALFREITAHRAAQQREKPKGDVSFHPPQIRARSNLVFLSARPRAYKDYLENKSYKLFRRLRKSGKLHCMPTLLGAGKLKSSGLAAIFGVVLRYPRPTLIGASLKVFLCSCCLGLLPMIFPFTFLTFAFAAFAVLVIWSFFAISSLRKEGRVNVPPLNSDFWRPVGEDRIKSFMEYRQLYSECSMLFFGDNGQGDLMCAEQLTRMNVGGEGTGGGGMVSAAFIHQVADPAEQLSELEKFEDHALAKEEYASRGIYLYRTYVGAAIHVYNLGFISQEGLFRVCTEAVQDMVRLRIRYLGCAEARPWREVVNEMNEDVDRANELLRDSGLQVAKAPISVEVNLARGPQVSVVLLSGRGAWCRADPARTVNELQKEAQQRLGVSIAYLITAVGAKLSETTMTMEEAGIGHDDYVQAVVASEAPNCPDPDLSRRSEHSLEDLESLVNLLLDAQIGLIRLEYLMELRARGDQLPRRQDAEHEMTSSKRTAIVSREELMELELDEMGHITTLISNPGHYFPPSRVRVSLHSISHPWETLEHPDPWGYQLQWLIEECRPALAEGLVWVFVDYTSLYQRGDRTEEQIQAVSHALWNAHVLYAHNAITVHRLESLTPETEKADGFIPVFSEEAGKVSEMAIKDLTMKDTPCSDRGWWRGEKHWSSPRTPGSSSHSIPLLPRLFNMLIDELVFTQDDDKRIVQEVHRKFFLERVSKCRSLTLEKLHEEAVDFQCEALRFYEQLDKIVLSQMSLKHDAVLAIAQTNAKSIHLKRCGLADYEVEILSHALKDEDHPVEELHLSHNPFGEKGMQALRELSILKPGLTIDVLQLPDIELEFGVPEVFQKILMVTPSSVFLEHKPTIEIIDFGTLKLPEGMMPASHLLQLSPEGVNFQKPVRFLVPTHIGANAAWRSNSDGSWEQVPAQFRHGYMEVYLSHFCQLYSSRPERTDFVMKAVAFLNPSASSEAPEGRLAFLEADCPTCEQDLNQRMDGVVRCVVEEAVDLFSPQREIHILQDGEVIQSFHLNFESGVQISEGFEVPLDIHWTHQLYVEMEVVDPETGRSRRRMYTFDFPDRSMSMPDPPPQPLPVPPPPPLIQNPVPPPLQGSPPDPPPNPPAEPPPVAPEVPRPPPPPIHRRHLMLSGRFNTTERVEYIRLVQVALESYGIETFMVDVVASQQFSSATREGLVKMRMMAAFCEWDYGSQTDVGYETFQELEYAWENRIPIIPVKLCQDWPPRPPDEAGRIQNMYVFRKSLIYIDAVAMSIQKVAEEIAQAWRQAA